MMGDHAELKMLSWMPTILYVSMSFTPIVVMMSAEPVYDRYHKIRETMVAMGCGNTPYWLGCITVNYFFCLGLSILPSIFLKQGDVKGFEAIYPVFVTEGFLYPIGLICFLYLVTPFITKVEIHVFGKTYTLTCKTHIEVNKLGENLK